MKKFLIGLVAAGIVIIEPTANAYADNSKTETTTNNTKITTVGFTATPGELEVLAKKLKYQPFNIDSSTEDVIINFTDEGLQKTSCDKKRGEDCDSKKTYLETPELKAAIDKTKYTSDPKIITISFPEANPFKEKDNCTQSTPAQTIISKPKSTVELNNIDGCDSDALGLATLYQTNKIEPLVKRVIDKQINMCNVDDNGCSYFDTVDGLKSIEKGRVLTQEEVRQESAQAYLTMVMILFSLVGLLVIFSISMHYREKY